MVPGRGQSKHKENNASKNSLFYSTQGESCSDKVKVLNKKEVKSF
jgi:hypothetical protein